MFFIRIDKRQGLSTACLQFPNSCFRNLNMEVDMDKGIFDREQMNLGCPQCGRHFTTKTIREIKRNPIVKCRFCGTSVKIQGDQLAKELRKFDTEWEKTKRQFKNLNLTIEL